MRRKLWFWAMAGIAAAGIAAALSALHWIPRAAEAWVATEGFRAMLSRQVSRSMKVEGQFAPLRLRDWRVKTDSFESAGMPGEAIGMLNVYGIEAEFDPAGVRHRAWKVRWIRAESGRIALRMPDDSKKIALSRGRPPPWAAIMPDRFDCGPITARSVLLEFPFQGRTATVSNIAVTATLVGRDFKYHGTHGALDCPLLPPLRVEEMDILVTRPMINITRARLRAIDPADPARADARLRLGMRDDKSVKAEIAAESLPFDQAMPEKLRGRLTGRASGRLLWENDASGGNARSNGSLRLEAVRLRDIPFLDELARVHRNPDLREFDFQEFACDFKLENDIFEARRVELVSEGKLRIEGDVRYHLSEGRGEVDVDLLEIPLAAWLPEEVKPRVSASAWGRFHWEGRPEQIEGSNAEGYLEIENGTIRNPVRIRGWLKPLGVDVPETIDLRRMAVHFAYAERVFRADNFKLDAPGFIRVNASGSWDSADQLEVDADIGGLDFARWLPGEWRRSLSGMAAVRGRWKAPRLDFGKGAGSATLRVDSARFARHKALDLLARFFKDDGFRRLDLEPATAAFAWGAHGIDVRDIDIRSAGRAGVRGRVSVAPDGSIDGRLEVGLPPARLHHLHGAEKDVFIRRSEGFAWAEVRLGGTIEKPTQDLTRRLASAVTRRPWTMFQLGLRAAGWWLGDLFGAAGGSR